MRTPLLIASVVVILVGLPAAGRAQALDWVRQFGTPQFDAAYDGAADAAGRIYVAGVVGGAFAGHVSQGNTDAFLAQYDAAGSQLWFRQFGTAGYDQALAVATSVGGHIYVAGDVDGRTTAANTDAFLAQYDAFGHQLWMVRFGLPGFTTTQATALATDAGGNVYVAGQAGSITGSAPFLALYDSSGYQAWMLLDVPMAHIASVATDVSGDIFIVGSAELDAVIALYTSAGHLVWTRDFSTPVRDVPTDVAVDDLGNLYVVGITDDYDYESAFIAQYDRNGNQRWVRFLTHPEFPPYIRSVDVDGMGNAFATGFTAGAFPGQPEIVGTFDAFMAKYDVHGTQLWVRQFGTADGDDAYAVMADPAGAVYVAGRTNGVFAGHASIGVVDAFLARFVESPDRLDGIAGLRATLAGTALHPGITRSLDAKLASALKSLEHGRFTPACGALRAFHHEVTAQRGRWLPESVAADLIGAASKQIGILGCR